MIRFKLEGKSQKGKNIIHRFGDEWFVSHSMSKTQCLDNEAGHMIVSVREVGEEWKGDLASTFASSRWIRQTNDKDFLIEQY